MDIHFDLQFSHDEALPLVFGHLATGTVDSVVPNCGRMGGGEEGAFQIQ